MTKPIINPPTGMSEEALDKLHVLLYQPILKIEASERKQEQEKSA